MEKVWSVGTPNNNIIIIIGAQIQRTVVSRAGLLLLQSKIRRVLRVGVQGYGSERHACVTAHYLRGMT